MIKTDNFGLIGQHRIDEPGYLDMGDSCMKTSIAILSGLLDPTLSELFIAKDLLIDESYGLCYNSDFLVVRHPTQKPYNDPKETSRDQLIPFLAVRYFINKRCFPLSHLGIKSKLSVEVYKNYRYFINKDFLGLPHIQWFMRKCKGDDSYSWLGDKMIRFDIWWASKNPDHELNQLFCMCLVLGKEYVQLLCNSHPDWRKNLRDYWSGWRDEHEIYEAFTKRIEREL